MGRPPFRTKKIAVIGMQWGYENKECVVRHLSDEFDWIVRFNGSTDTNRNFLPNINPDNLQIKSYLSSNVVIELQKLINEIENSTRSASSIYVDLDAFVSVAEYESIDSTILTKFSGKGTRIRDLQNSAEYHRLKDLGVNFVSTIEMLPRLDAANVLFEGTQGVMLDVNHGVYPFVSMSDCMTTGISLSGLSSIKLHEILGVVKCYSTRVDKGPFPSECTEENMRILVQESTRVGWLDLPALRYACLKSGVTSLVVTGLNDLNRKNIGDSYVVCEAYENGDPKSPSDFFNQTPRRVPRCTWKISNTFDSAVNKLFQQITKKTGVKISHYANGDNKNDFHNLEKWAS